MLSRTLTCAQCAHQAVLDVTIALYFILLVWPLRAVLALMLVPCCWGAHHFLSELACQGLPLCVCVATVLLVAISDKEGLEMIALAKQAFDFVPEATRAFLLQSPRKGEIGFWRFFRKPSV